MKKRKIFLISLIFLVLLIVFCFFASNTELKTVKYEIETDKVDNKVKVALLTDLHGCEYGENQEELISAIDLENPDIILLGGDIFDDVVPYDKSELTLELLANRYPIFYVTGNHEYWSNDIENIYEILEKNNVTILEGESETVKIGNEEINICGVTDPDVILYTESNFDIYSQLESLQDIHKNEKFTILLSHRPELIETYQNYSFDLVLSGHAHGGQWRLPGIINGLFAPNQGLFPKYAGGKYDFGNMTFIVSRGLAKESTKVPRFFNPPELVIIEIE